MSYSLIRELVNLTEEFEQENIDPKKLNIRCFTAWLSNRVLKNNHGHLNEPDWIGKDSGRTPESIINTLIVHLYRYAKIYSKNALFNSAFTTIDDVIFLLNLLHFGSMTKIKLIELNILEKSTGIQIINRLINKGFIAEEISVKDKRSKEICITDEGKDALNEIMENIRNASRIVVGDLYEKEKLELIRILQKLEMFHVSNVKHARQLQ
jgi:MarR family transcriptional regulator, lower aerobic nicotinate degradation pathway regulator